MVDNAYINIENHLILFSEKSVKHFRASHKNAAFYVIHNLNDAFSIIKPIDSTKLRVYGGIFNSFRFICFDSLTASNLTLHIKNSSFRKYHNIYIAFQDLYGYKFTEREPSQIHNSSDIESIELVPYLTSKSKNKSKSTSNKQNNNNHHETIPSSSLAVSPKNNTAIIYTDGSYSAKQNVLGMSYEMFCDDKHFAQSSFVKTSKKEANSLSAELLSVMMAISRAKEEGIKRILVHYDCEAIQIFSQKLNPENKFCSQYFHYIKSMEKCLDIEFVKVKAHSGNVYNNHVDKLASYKNLLRFADMF